MTFAIHSALTEEDFEYAAMVVGGRSKLTRPDLVIAPDGAPYLYRWHVVPKNDKGGLYFHIQVASDPERPLHDHPWDNTSVILSGGYDEIWEPAPWHHPRHMIVAGITRRLRKGDTVHRRAGEAHRLILPPEFPYTMTLFSTGPKLRKWGFWFPDGWRAFDTVTKTLADGRSVMREEYRNGNV